ncbi:MAG: hypothetical protein RJB02_984 [Pseudomonadota bacterium]|jgi:hypothetical protein
MTVADVFPIPTLTLHVRTMLTNGGSKDTPFALIFLALIETLKQLQSEFHAGRKREAATNIIAVDV